MSNYKCFYFYGRRMSFDTLLDLFMAPIKIQGWVNIYTHDYKDHGLVGTIYKSKGDVIKSGGSGNRLIATVIIEWEE